MKVALISLARRGGMVHFQTELANAMVRILPTVVIRSSLAENAPISRTVKRHSIDTGHGGIDSLVRALNPLYWFRLYDILVRSEADVLHIVAVHEWNPIVCLLSKRLGKPLIYTMHDPEAHPGAPTFIRAADWITSKMADAIVVLTQHGKTQLRSKGVPAQKITVIPHPMYSVFRRWRRQNVRRENLILYFGRMERYKGLDVLVRAFAAVRKSLPDWKLLLAGSGQVPPGLMGDGSDGIQILNRYISNVEVAGLMQRARFVVVPYTAATQSGVIAVAYALGLPVIASDVGGLNEMVVGGMTGLLVPANDPRSLEQAILALATRRNLVARMRKHIYSIGRHELNPLRIAGEHARLYANVLARQTGP